MYAGLFFLVLVVIVGIVFLACKNAMTGDYPGRREVEKAIREKKAEKEAKKGGK